MNINNIKYTTFDKLIQDRYNFDELGNPLSDIKLFEFDDVKELIKNQRRLLSEIKKLKREIEYIEWKRRQDKKQKS